MRVKLVKMDCRVSLTSDLWTSSSGDRGFICITGHFIDDNWVLRKRVLNFSALPSPHTGVHIAKTIWDKLVK